MTTVVQVLSCFADTGLYFSKMTEISGAFSVSFTSDSCASEKDPTVRLADKVESKTGIAIMKCKKSI